jgi:hypothetical protein
LRGGRKGYNNKLAFFIHPRWERISPNRAIFFLFFSLLDTECLFKSGTGLQE